MERISALNPNAQPWDPRIEKAREEERTIFFTFSKERPITRKEIHSFFTRNYGNYIEKIYVHYSIPRQTPLFGKVVFTKYSISAMIFGDQKEKHFIIKSKSLWCKRYTKREVRHQ